MFNRKTYKYSTDFKIKNYNKQIEKWIFKIDTEQIIWVLSKIAKWNREWYLTAIVHLTGDLAHPGHIAYIQTIRKKIADKFNISDEDIKLIIWLEDENRTVKRKWKKPILNNEERQYQRENIKWVDAVYIRNIPMNLYPSDIACYLDVDVFVSHEEYFDFNKYLRVSKKLRRMNFKTKTMIIKNLDVKKYLWKDIRNENNLSTTWIVERIVKKQTDLVFKILKQNGYWKHPKWNTKTPRPNLLRE